ncbi:MAG: hypothetical protein KC635_12540 [Myxococcales bacterium]|nr:hypothetical protein [Myxococcales bacterium]MCB9735120.1 hypothetical protein [Deltaproteobacteria bacterium]
MLQYVEKKEAAATRATMDGDAAATRAPSALKGVGFADGERALSPVGAGAAPVQMKPVENKAKGVWVSDIDPSREFATEAEALAWEHALPMPDPISEKGRPRTLFSYMKTKSTNKLSSLGVHQGPHTVGYAAYKEALFASKGAIDLKHVASEQVMPPEAWKAAVEKEFADKGGEKGIFEGKGEKSAQVRRAYAHYVGLYNELQRHLEAKSGGAKTVAGAPGKDDPYDIIHELTALGPFAVYGYTRTEKIGKKHLKGKGETKDLADDKNIDRLGDGMLSDVGGLGTYIEDARLLLDPDFVDEELDDVDMEDVPATAKAQSELASEVKDVSKGVVHPPSRLRDRATLKPPEPPKTKKRRALAGPAAPSKVAKKAPPKRKVTKGKKPV